MPPKKNEIFIILWKGRWNYILELKLVKEYHFIELWQERIFECPYFWTMNTEENSSFIKNFFFYGIDMNFLSEQRLEKKYILYNEQKSFLFYYSFPKGELKKQLQWMKNLKPPLSPVNGQYISFSFVFQWFF